MIKEERKKKARVKKLLVGLACFVVLLVLAVVIEMKVFVVKTVNVVGNEFYDETLIKETILSGKGSNNSLYVFLKYTFVDVDTIPFVDAVEVTLDNPTTLTIKVYEKGMMGYIEVGSTGQLAYFDKDGFVVETSSSLIDDIPKIDGVSCSEVVLYEQLPLEESLLKQILTLTQDLKRVGLEPDAILYGAECSPVLYYGEVEVLLGSMELSTQKIERLSEILPSLEGMAGTLHLEDWEENTNIVFEKNVVEETENTEDIDEEEIVEEDAEEEVEE